MDTLCNFPAMNWNAYFNPAQYMSQVEYSELIWGQRIFNTRGYLTKEQAELELPMFEKQELRDGLYYGCIVTSKPQAIDEAVKIIKERGFGETILGLAVTDFNQIHLN